MIDNSDQPTSQQDVVKNSHKTFKNLTLTTLFINIPFILMVLIGLFMPVRRGSEAGIVFIPVIIIGMFFAITYLFYFPYYMVRYKNWGSIAKLGAFIFAAIVITIVFLIGSMVYLANTRS